MKKPPRKFTELEATSESGRFARQGCDFYKIARELWPENLDSVLNDNLKTGTPFTVSIPVVAVNLSLSLELLLKAFYILDYLTEAPRIHDLGKLFSELKSGRRKRFDAILSPPAGKLAFELKHAANAFEEWRYLQFKDGASIQIDHLLIIGKYLLAEYHNELPGPKNDYSSANTYQSYLLNPYALPRP